MKNFKYIFILSCLWLIACTQDNDFLPREAEKATVHLNLQNAAIDVETRSTTPQDPQTDNPMYSLWLLHYNSEGQLIETIYKDLQDPQLTYTWNPTLIISGGNETICLVANMNESEAPTWPERLAVLKETFATLRIDDKSGLIAEKKMYMFGYYEGPLSSGQYINIMMGRMAAALKFVINANNSSDKYQIDKIEIQNASRGTYYFPHESKSSNFGANISETFENNIIGDESNELIYYYQVGENINPAADKYTTIVITATKGEYQTVTEQQYVNGPYYDKRGRLQNGWHWEYVQVQKWKGTTTETYTVVLGADAPGTANRNYSLYRNNNYTFNITLKN